MQLSYIFQKCILYSMTAVILTEYIFYIISYINVELQVIFSFRKKECTVFLSF